MFTQIFNFNILLNNEKRELLKNILFYLKNYYFQYVVKLM